jgi:rhodanese-related sulfurtransferase
MKEGPMPDDLRITIDDWRKRMDAGEDFTIIDTRNPQAWSESNEKIPQAIRVPVDGFQEHLSEIPKNKPIVAYCT